MSYPSLSAMLTQQDTNYKMELSYHRGRELRRLTWSRARCREFSRQQLAPNRCLVGARLDTAGAGLFQVHHLLELPPQHRAPLGQDLQTAKTSRRGKKRRTTQRQKRVRSSYAGSYRGHSDVEHPGGRHEFW